MSTEVAPAPGIKPGDTVWIYKYALSTGVFAARVARVCIEGDRTYVKTIPTSGAPQGWFCRVGKECALSQEDALDASRALAAKAIVAAEKRLRAMRRIWDGGPKVVGPDGKPVKAATP